MQPGLVPWIILFLPLLAAALITLFTQHDRKLSAGLSIGAVVAGFVLSLDLRQAERLGAGCGESSVDLADDGRSAGGLRAAV